MPDIKTQRKTYRHTKATHIFFHVHQTPYSCINEDMKKILIVDDKEDIRDMLADFLTNAGHEVETCAEGGSAFQQANQSPYSLVISDLIMPGTNGFELVKLLKEESKYNKDSPIIIMTGGSTSFDFQDNVIKLEQKGCKILRKPFTKDQFIETVTKALS